MNRCISNRTVVISVRSCRVEGLQLQDPLLQILDDADTRAHPQCPWFVGIGYFGSLWFWLRVWVNGIGLLVISTLRLVPPFYTILTGRHPVTFQLLLAASQTRYHRPRSFTRLRFHRWSRQGSKQSDNAEEYKQRQGFSPQCWI